MPVMMGAHIRWADNLSSIVEVPGEELCFTEDEACQIWYGPRELEYIDEELQKVIKTYNACYKKYVRQNKSSFCHIEDEFLSKCGHSLRGLEPYEECIMKHQIMTVRAVNDMLNRKPRALQTSKKHAQEAYQRGILDHDTVVKEDKLNTMQQRSKSEVLRKPPGKIIKRFLSEPPNKSRDKGRSVGARMKKFMSKKSS